jgi:hypothetical protein
VNHIHGGRHYGNFVGGNNMRHRSVVLTCSAVCVVVVLLCWQRKLDPGISAAVTPYTAHFTISANRIFLDGSSWNTVSTETRARDRQGRIYVKKERAFRNGEQRTESEMFWFFVEDPAKLQTLSWESNGKTVVLGRWPYWSGRKGCWRDERGQHQSSFGDEYKVPDLPAEGKLETIAEIADSSGDKRIRTRVVTENLGRKEIHGMTAFGTRSSMTPLENGGPLALPETTTEIWRSRELDFKLLQVTSGPKYGLRRVELSDLKRGDPDPALFEPPQGYKVETVQYHQVPCEQK